MPGTAPLSPGDPQAIGGYRLLGRLGSGGQGVVYQGHSDRFGMVAIKALHAAWLSEPGAHSRLAKEVSAARRVAPFCTARVLEAQLDGEQPFVVSEFIPGQSLNEHVRRQGPLTGTALDRLAVGTMTALVAIHEANLVHRDFKPSNVVLGPDGPRVVDFGIARDLSGQGTRTDAMIGTPAFMSPEQVSGAQVGPSADLFSWATTMVFAATGRSPFDGEHIAAVLYRVATEDVDLSGVPDPLAGVLRACQAKDPVARPTAQQVLMVLLGQPMPARDVDDPTALLAHAATVVGDAARAGAATTVPAPPASATVREGTHAQQPAPAGNVSTVHEYRASLPPPYGPPQPEPGGAARGYGPPSGHPYAGGQHGQPYQAQPQPSSPQPSSPQPSSPQPSSPQPSSLPQAPSTRSRDRAARSGRRVSPWSIGVAAVGVVALIGAAATVTLAEHDGTSAIVVASGPTVPAGYAGSWIGSMSRNNSPYPVRFDLRQGSTVGQVAYATCQGVLVVTKLEKDGSSLTMTGTTTVDPGRNCLADTEITLRRPTQPSAGSAGQAPTLEVRSTDLTSLLTDAATGTVTRTG